MKTLTFFYNNNNQRFSTFFAENYNCLYSSTHFQAEKLKREAKALIALTSLCFMV